MDANPYKSPDSTPEDGAERRSIRRRREAVVALVLSALFFGVAANALLSSPNRPKRLSNFVGYAVGVLVVPVVLLILGANLWQSATTKPTENSPPL